MVEWSDSAPVPLPWDASPGDDRWMFHLVQSRSHCRQDSIESTALIRSHDPIIDWHKCLSFSFFFHWHDLFQLRAVSQSLSLRKLFEIVQQLDAYKDGKDHKEGKEGKEGNLSSLLRRACLSRFLPVLTRSALEGAMKRAGIVDHVPVKNSMEHGEQLKCTVFFSLSLNNWNVPYSSLHLTGEVRDGILHIGNVSTKVYNAENRAMVPDTLFYENQEVGWPLVWWLKWMIQNIATMSDMLRDFLLGFHLLLIGNQGTGKNKLTDRFLHLLNRPRQYMQLHRLILSFSINH